MMRKICRILLSFGALATFLFLVTADAAQNPPSGTQTQWGSNIVIPGIPNQGENFLRESLNIIPDDLNEFKVGGGSVIFPPAGGYRFQFKFNPGLKVPPMLSCGGLNIGASLKSSLNDVKEGAMGALAAVQQTITSLITSFPLLAIAYLSPTVYEVLTKGIDASFSEFFQMDFPSCEDLKKKADEIASTSGGVESLVGLRSEGKGSMLSKTSFSNAQSQTVALTANNIFSTLGLGSSSAEEVREKVEKEAVEKSKVGEQVAQADGSTKTVAGVDQEPMTQATVLQPVVDAYVQAQGQNSTLRLLAGKLNPNETLTEQEAKDILIVQLEKAIGQATVRQVATSSDTPAAVDAQTTGGAGVGVVYNLYQTNISQAFTQVITKIKERPDLNATAEDVREIAKVAGGYMLTPQALKAIANATSPPGDPAILRLEAALISALTYRTMVLWLMEEKGLLTVMGSNSGSAGPLQANMVSRIISAFSSIWSGDEMSLRRELMWADKNVAEAMMAITDLQERRKAEVEKTLRS